MDYPDQPRRLKRLWMPLVTVLLAGLGLTGIFLADVLEPHKQFISVALIVLLTPLLLAFWVLFFSGLRWGQRFALLGCGVVLLVGAGFALSKAVRQEGSINGAGTPRYVWSWTPPRSEASLSDLTIDSKGKEAGQVDLSVKEDTDYPQFLGRDRDGVAHGVRLERDWKAKPPKELWRQKIGPGWSAFAASWGLRRHAGAARRKRAGGVLRTQDRQGALDARP